MGPSILTNKRGQGWGLDLIAGVIIFIAGVMVLYVYAINYTSQSNKVLDELYYEGNLISELMLTDEPYGIITDGVVDQTKLDLFNSSYDVRKDTYGVRHDFYFTMENMEVGGNYVSEIGKVNTTTTKDLMKITRIVAYKNRPTKLEVFVYEE